MFCFLFLRARISFSVRDKRAIIGISMGPTPQAYEIGPREVYAGACVFMCGGGGGVGVGGGRGGEGRGERGIGGTAVIRLRYEVYPHTKCVLSQGDGAYAKCCPLEQALRCNLVRPRE